MNEHGRGGTATGATATATASAAARGGIGARVRARVGRRDFHVDVHRIDRGLLEECTAGIHAAAADTAARRELGRIRCEQRRHVNHGIAAPRCTRPRRTSE